MKRARTRWRAGAVLALVSGLILSACTGGGDTVISGVGNSGNNIGEVGLLERVARESLDNVVVVRGRFEDPELPDGEIDLAMTCLTYHHIEDRAAYFRQLQVDLSPRGRVVHLDDRDDVPPPFRWFQSAGHWTDPASMREEMAEAGYRRVETFSFLPLQSFQIFVAEDERLGEGS